MPEPDWVADALENTYPWRTGTQVGRTIYACPPGSSYRNGEYLIGMMDSEADRRPRRPGPQPVGRRVRRVRLPRRMNRLAKVIGYTVLAWAVTLALVELDWRRHRNHSSRCDAPNA